MSKPSRLLSYSRMPRLRLQAAAQAAQIPLFLRCARICHNHHKHCLRANQHTLLIMKKENEQIRPVKWRRAKTSGVARERIRYISRRRSKRHRSIARETLIFIVGLFLCCTCKFHFRVFFSLALKVSRGFALHTGERERVTRTVVVARGSACWNTEISD